jgi:hypothetical protein
VLYNCVYIRNFLSFLTLNIDLVLFGTYCAATKALLKGGLELDIFLLDKVLDNVREATLKQ